MRYSCKIFKFYEKVLPVNSEILEHLKNIESLAVYLFTFLGSTTRSTKGPILGRES